MNRWGWTFRDRLYIRYNVRTFEAEISLPIKNYIPWAITLMLRMLVGLSMRSRIWSEQHKKPYEWPFLCLNCVLATDQPWSYWRRSKHRSGNRADERGECALTPWCLTGRKYRDVKKEVKRENNPDDGDCFWTALSLLTRENKVSKVTNPCLIDLLR